jgi:hypothetical protein
MEWEVEPPLKKFVPDNANLKVLESYGKVLDDDYWSVWEKNEYKKEKGSLIDHRKGGELASKLDMEEKSKVETIQDMLENGADQLSSIAMTVSTDVCDVAGLSMVSVFNRELFQSGEGRGWFASTQVVTDGQAVSSTDKFVNMALLYRFRKAMEEVKGFHSSDVVSRIGVEIEGVLLSKGMLLQGMEFLETAAVDVDLGAMGIRTSLLVLDRHGPLSYSIAQYVHWDLSVHRGAET